MKKRVEEELEKRKDEIEAEVTRRVEAAKVQMEREMMLELEKRREQARLEEQKREVNIFNDIDFVLKHVVNLIGFRLKSKTQNLFTFLYL